MRVSARRDEEERGGERNQRTLCEAMPRAEDRLAQLAVSDDAHGRLAAPVRGVEHGRASLLGGAALEAQGEPDGRAWADAVRRERLVEVRGELARAKDEALLGDGDARAVGDGELELVDGARVCARGKGWVSLGRFFFLRLKAGDAPKESELPERSRTKQCMVAGLGSGESLGEASDNGAGSEGRGERARASQLECFCLAVPQSAQTQEHRVPRRDGSRGAGPTAVMRRRGRGPATGHLAPPRAWRRRVREAYAEETETHKGMDAKASRAMRGLNEAWVG